VLVQANIQTKVDWAFLIASAFLLLNALNGVKTGTTTLIYRSLKRSEDGALYWFTIWCSVVLGVAGLLIVWRVAQV
jgi:hypothetical protein